jgi:hypothetical protein
MAFEVARTVQWSIGDFEGGQASLSVGQTQFDGAESRRVEDKAKERRSDEKRRRRKRMRRTRKGEMKRKKLNWATMADEMERESGLIVIAVKPPIHLFGCVKSHSRLSFAQT